MRVLLVAGTVPPGQCGVGDYVARLAHALSMVEDIQVGVLSTPGARLAGAPRVELLAPPRAWTPSELPALLRTLRSWKPGIVHIHYPSQGFYGRWVPVLLPLLCRAMGVRVVQTWHEAWPLRALAQVLLLRAGANGLVFVRPSYRQLLPRSLRPLLASLPQATVVSAATLPLSRQSPEEARQVRQRYLQGRTRLVVFFGFVHSAKGIEQLFDIANPETDALVIAGAAKDAQYLGKLRRVAADKGWPPTQVQFTGFLQEQQAADLLAVADAVVLPFLAGAGDWNTSVQGALAQGTLVITTARQPAGDDASRNLYTAAIANVDEMRRALAQLAGRRVPATGIERAWASIADRHIAFYRGLQGTISR